MLDGLGQAEPEAAIRGRPAIPENHRPDGAIRDGLPHADLRPRADRLSQQEPASTSSRCTDPDVEEARHLSPPAVCSPGGWPNATCSCIQLFHRGWDQHGNLPRTIIRNQCRDIDQPTRALIEDLQASATCSRTR